MARVESGEAHSKHTAMDKPKKQSKIPDPQVWPEIEPRNQATTGSEVKVWLITSR